MSNKQFFKGATLRAPTAVRSRGQKMVTSAKVIYDRIGQLWLRAPERPGGGIIQHPLGLGAQGSREDGTRD